MIRIGNASGFYGDRFSAMSEMLRGGDLDVLTGDYLAELTMLILGRDLLADSSRGYAKTFVRQMRENLAAAKESGVTIVTNAGGLNPAGLAAALRELSDELGIAVDVAHVEGDDLRERAEELDLYARSRDGRAITPLTANAYLGAWGIAEALRAGADIVVTGRVTDASLVVGPAAAHYEWGRTDYDALAGAVVAGHVIECGAQATGGNYAFFTELGSMQRPGFPIAEINADGSSVITKHDGTGGAVTTGTVTAQLLYEVAGPAYPGPDVTARFDTIELTHLEPDRVGITGARGEPPPAELKVGLNAIGGFRNEVTFVLTGLDIEAKAALVSDQLTTALQEKPPAEIRWSLARTDTDNAWTEEEASALLHCVVTDPDSDTVGRSFSGAAVELALASYPGFHVTAPPSEAAPYGIFSAAYLDADVVGHAAVLADGTRLHIAPAPETQDRAADVGAQRPPEPTPPEPTPPESRAFGATTTAPLGTIAGARSGDKGGSANLGVWVRDSRAWHWLVDTLTVAELKRLLPETAELDVRRYAFENLLAVNFVIDDILGDGVASQARFDPQAKALGEWLRARHVEIPEELL